MDVWPFKYRGSVLTVCRRWCSSAHLRPLTLLHLAVRWAECNWSSSGQDEQRNYGLGFTQWRVKTCHVPLGIKNASYPCCHRHGQSSHLKRSCLLNLTKKNIQHVCFSFSACWVIHRLRKSKFIVACSVQGFLSLYPLFPIFVFFFLNSKMPH